jgi:hypothetical protein
MACLLMGDRGSEICSGRLWPATTIGGLRILAHVQPRGPQYWHLRLAEEMLEDHGDEGSMTMP